MNGVLVAGTMAVALRSNSARPSIGRSAGSIVGRLVGVSVAVSVIVGLGETVIVGEGVMVGVRDGVVEGVNGAGKVARTDVISTTAALRVSAGNCAKVGISISGGALLHAVNHRPTMSNPMIHLTSPLRYAMSIYPKYIPNDLGKLGHYSVKKFCTCA